MENRINKLNRALNIIFQPLYEIAVDAEEECFENTVKLLLQLENRNMILVGSRDTIWVSNLTNYELEDMLNLLYQFDKIIKYENTLSGRAYYVHIRLNKECKIVTLRHTYKKIA